MSIAPRYLPPNTTFIEDDDLPVTMQIGMIGKDGIVLASDKKWSTTWVKRDRAKIQELRDEHSDSKILLSPTGNLAVCCADDMIAANDVAQKVISGWSPETDDSQGSALNALVKPLCSHRPFQCIVASTHPEPSLFYISNDLRFEDRPLSI